MRLAFVIVLFWMGTEIRGQTLLDWSDLSEGISWELSSPEDIFAGFQKATFSPELKALEGKQVIITGYLLVLGGNPPVYLLSKNPMATCFFCGNGGPETILELQFTEKTSFIMDELISVEGTLHLNEGDPNACYYKIDNADAQSYKQVIQK